MQIDWLNNPKHVIATKQSINGCGWQSTAIIEITPAKRNCISIYAILHVDENVTIYRTGGWGITGRVGIDKRPEVVGMRTRVGDIEVGLVLSSNHKSALLVMLERTTLVTIIEKLKSKNADVVYKKNEP